jgi:GH24 family phage-related lysozyme (muramidase)
MSITPAVLARTRKFEGSVAHMYLDTVGEVTIGTGHLVASATAAGTLVLIVSATGKAATTAQKKSEYAEMKKQLPGKKPGYYKGFATLEISSAESDSLLLADLTRAEGDLKSIFSGYSAFPGGAQEALIDMAFNLGKTNFLEYEQLIAACKAADWKRAAAESHRNGIPADRNDEIRQLFESLAPKPAVRELAHEALAALARTLSEQPSGLSSAAGVRRMSVELNSGSVMARVIVDTAEPAAAITRLRALPESCRDGMCFHALASDDLEIGEHVPGASEVATCGAIVKKIRRTDPEFATLVRCENGAVRFKDEEGTGADRMMSPRLRDALDKLAAATSLEWPGTRLRVTEAWDEDNEHAGTSLHYEGRAADLTTDPIDPRKLGRLGRLAATCGFDWVLYENAAHLHVSVRR